LTARKSIAGSSGRSGREGSIVIALRGEMNSVTAGRLGSLARSLIAEGVPALAIDCTEAPGVTGHLLGELRSIVAAGAIRGIPVGVAASSSSAAAIHRHTPAAITAPTVARLLESLGCEREAPRIGLVTRRPPEDALDS